jgi:hypothetical protein
MSLRAGPEVRIGGVASPRERCTIVVDDVPGRVLCHRSDLKLGGAEFGRRVWGSAPDGRWPSKKLTKPNYA